MINRYGRWMDINYVTPKSINECYVHFDYFLETTGDVNIDRSDIVEVTNDEAMRDGIYYNLDKFDESDVKFIKESIVD